MKKLVSKRLRNSAKGQMCTLRLDDCNYNRETTVLAHIRMAGRAGAGQKPNDYEACFACSSCHDVIDGRKKGYYTDRDITRACFETWQFWHKYGFIEFK